MSALGSPSGLLDDVFAVGAKLRHVLLILLGSNGLVQKEQINVVHLKLLERAFHRPLHLVGLMQVIPHFRGDEKVGSLHAWVLGEEVPHCRQPRLHSGRTRRSRGDGNLPLEHGRRHGMSPPLHLH